MKSNVVSFMSFGISLAAMFIVSFPTLPRTVGFDYMGVIFTALATLVAILLVTQLVNYMFVRERMYRIVSDEVKVISDDFKAAIDGISMLVVRGTFIDCTMLTSYFFLAMEALRKISVCSDENLRNNAAKYILGFARDVISKKSKNTPCFFFLGYRNEYLQLLRQFSADDFKEVTAFVEDDTNAIKELPELPLTQAFGIRVENDTIRLIRS